MQGKTIVLIIGLIVMGVVVYFIVSESTKKPEMSELKIEQPVFEKGPTMKLGPLVEEKEEKKEEKEEKEEIKKPSLKKSDLRLEIPTFEKGPTFDIGSLF